MTDNTLVIYGTVTINCETNYGEEVTIYNESGTKDFMEYTKSNGKYQIDCSGFDEGEVCFINVRNKKIILKTDSTKTPYKIDIIINNNSEITSELNVVV